MFLMANVISRRSSFSSYSSCNTTFYQQEYNTVMENNSGFRNNNKRICIAP